MKDTDTLINEVAEVAASLTKTELLRQYRFLSPRCESEIERVMLAALILRLSIARPPLDPVSFMGASYCWPDRNHPYDGTHGYLQAEVGDYRADFLIQITDGQKRAFVVIECDGHDFHERTKEQARRDRERDRWMVAQDITVLRYTGSEIWRDPVGCATNVEDILWRLEERLGGDTT